MGALLYFLLAGIASAEDEAGEYLAKNAADPDVVTLPSGLQYKVLRAGSASGKSPGPASPCLCHYEGTLIDGKVFDSSIKRGQPATFAPNQVIREWHRHFKVIVINTVLRTSLSCFIISIFIFPNFSNVIINFECRRLHIFGAQFDISVRNGLYVFHS